MIGAHHLCQQRHREGPACGLPHPPKAQPPLQLSVSRRQAEARQHTHDSVALDPKTLNLQVYVQTKTQREKHVNVTQYSDQIHTVLLRGKYINVNCVSVFKHQRTTDVSQLTTPSSRGLLMSRLALQAKNTE